MAVNTGEKPTSINDLQPKMELTGTVKKVELFGAFVDVGVGHDGLLHISQLSTDHVRNVTDVVKEGDKVSVWVMAVDREKGRFNLTMIRPAEHTWDDIKQNDILTGKVIRVERFGAFVDIGAERPGRIHVSELSTEYVKNPEDVVKVGDEVKVKVLTVNAQKRQIDLSIKALDDSAVVEQIEDDEPQGDIPTAMELALRRAMEGTEMESSLRESKPGKSKRNKKRERYSRQDEILSRTLQHRKN
jgi:small subunit ribosomal protein S1